MKKNLTPARYVDDAGTEITAVHIETADDIRAARKLEDWHDGQVRILTFPTAEPQLFVGYEAPLGYMGVQLRLGQWLAKGPAGDLRVVPAATFEDSFKAVA